MDNALAPLIAAALAFVGTHFALSHPLRGPLVRLTGAKAFPALYSLVALATFAWLAIEFRAAPLARPLWNGGSDGAWIIASLLTLVASVLFTGSFQGNPAMPDPRAAALAAKGPHGVFYMTSHPMMWGFALWAAAHIAVSPTPRVLVLAGSVAFLALVGSHMQDRKKEVLMGEAWAHVWLAYVPAGLWRWVG